MKLLKWLLRGPNFLAQPAACLVYRICGVTGWQNGPIPPTLDAGYLSDLANVDTFIQGTVITGSYVRVIAAEIARMKNRTHVAATAKRRILRPSEEIIERALEFISVEETGARRLPVAN
jgi:hypothetical protein